MFLRCHTRPCRHESDEPLCAPRRRSGEEGCRRNFQVGAGGFRYKSERRSHRHFSRKTQAIARRLSSRRAQVCVTPLTRSLLQLPRRDAQRSGNQHRMHLSTQPGLRSCLAVSGHRGTFAGSHGVAPAAGALPARVNRRGQWRRDGSAGRRRSRAVRFGRRAPAGPCSTRARGNACHRGSAAQRASARAGGRCRGSRG